MGVQRTYRLLTELAERPMVGSAHPDYFTLTEQEGRGALLAAAEVLELVKTAMNRTSDFMRHLLPPDSSDRWCEYAGPITAAMRVQAYAHDLAWEILPKRIEETREAASATDAELEEEWRGDVEREGKSGIYEAIQIEEDRLRARLAALEEDRQRLGRAA